MTTSLRRRNYVNSNLLRVVSHDFAGNLGALRETLRLMNDEHKLDGVIRFLNYEQKHLDDILVWLSVVASEGRLITKRSIVSLRGCLTEAFRHATVHARGAELPQLSLDAIPDNASVSTDRRLFCVIMDNLFVNAVKNGATRIAGNSVKDGDNVIITISDNGPGFPWAVINWVERRDVNKDHRTLERGGMGLEIVLDFVAILNGRCKVMNDPDGGGAIVRLVFPA
jgi:K+-sensing histidine kinase KdpD